MAYIKTIKFTPEPEPWTEYLSEICILDYKKNCIFVHLHKENKIEWTIFNPLAEQVSKNTIGFNAAIPKEYKKSNISEYTKEELKEILLIVGIKILEVHYTKGYISKPTITDILDTHSNRGAF